MTVDWRGTHNLPSAEQTAHNDFGAGAYVAHSSEMFNLAQVNQDPSVERCARRLGWFAQWLLLGLLTV